MPSARQLPSSPRPSSSHARPGRQPVKPNTHDDGRDQQQVGDRVGEVDRDDERPPAGVGDQDVVGDRGAERGRGEARDEAVEPRAAVEVAGAAADEQDERDVAQRVEAEPQRVGERDVRHRAVGVHDPEADIARPCRTERRGHRGPRAPLGGHEEGAGAAQRGGPGVGGAAHPGLPERDRARDGRACRGGPRPRRRRRSRRRDAAGAWTQRGASAQGERSGVESG